MTELSVEARRAIDHVRAIAEADRDAAVERLTELSISSPEADALVSSLRSTAALTVNFHPDRLDGQGRTVAAGLRHDGRYRPQHETGLSSGERSAVPGGRRMRWESDMFGGAYDDTAAIRPVYGAFDVLRDPFGGSPRFGSCHLVLHRHCLDRTTLCVGDSHVGPVDVGTIDAMASIAAGLLEACARGQFGPGITIDALRTSLASADGPVRPARDLDHYVEAQIHGPIDLGRDVATIVLDPSFRTTGVERQLSEAAAVFGFTVAWHEGSVIRPDEIDPAFRGPTIVDLAHHTTRTDGLIDAATIGRALASTPYTPPTPVGDDETSPFQHYKKLWHALLHHGHPAYP